MTIRKPSTEFELVLAILLVGIVLCAAIIALSVYPDHFDATSPPTSEGGR